MASKVSTEDLLETFKGMTLLELSEFIKQFEETFDVQAAAMAAPMAAGAPAAPAEATELPAAEAPAEPVAEAPAEPEAPAEDTTQG